MDVKSKIIAKLQQLRHTALGQIHLGIIEDKVVQGAVIQPWARLNFVISGQKNLLLPLYNGCKKITLKTGDGQFSPPYSWELQDWRGEFELLCIVPRSNYLRISYYSQTATNPGTPEYSFFHTGHEYSEAIDHVSNALATLAVNPDNAVTQNLARAMIKLALAECRCPANEKIPQPMLLFRRISCWVENSFQDNIDRETAAQMFGISSGYVSQLFTRYGKRGFNSCLTECRMRFARRLLRESHLPVYQIAAQCGYGNYVHFVRKFRELHHVSPGIYRVAANSTEVERRYGIQPEHNH